MVHAFNPSTWEAGDLCEFKASLSTTPGQPELLYRQKLYLKNQKKILVLKFVLIFKIASSLQ